MSAAVAVVAKFVPILNETLHPLFSPPPAFPSPHPFILSGSLEREISAEPICRNWEGTAAVINPIKQLLMAQWEPSTQRA